MKNSKWIRNILTGLLASGMALSLIACGSLNAAPASAQTKEEETQTASEDKEAVSDVQSEQQESDNTAEPEEAVETETTGSDSGGKILILYFSADNTKDVDAGSGDGGTYDDIRELEPNATVVGGLAIAGEDAGKDDAKARVEEWAAGLNLN